MTRDEALAILARAEDVRETIRTKGGDIPSGDILMIDALRAALQREQEALAAVLTARIQGRREGLDRAASEDTGAFGDYLRTLDPESW